jgi:hypothetical protein
MAFSLTKRFPGYIDLLQFKKKIDKLKRKGYFVKEISKDPLNVSRNWYSVKLEKRDVY